MMKLVLLRHGESDWNRENRFTGWTDVDLSEKGVAEAHEGGRLMKAEGLVFDVAYTSVLKRAIRTLWIALDEMDLMWIPVIRDWRLNERHYGALQGLNKAETAAKHGEDQVKIWRRSYSITPPPLEESDPRFPGHDPRYASLAKDDLPRTESLELTVRRFLPAGTTTSRPRSNPASASSSPPMETRCARWSNTSTTFPRTTSWDSIFRPACRWCMNSMTASNRSSIII